MRAAAEFLRSPATLAQSSQPFAAFPAEVVCSDHSEQGAALFGMHTLDGVFGATTLILTGSDAETEADFCRDYQARMRCPQWRLPMPPMEVAVRPLFFTVTFHMASSHRRYAHYWKASTPYLNGIGLAVLAQFQRGLPDG